MKTVLIRLRELEVPAFHTIQANVEIIFEGWRTDSIVQRHPTVLTVAHKDWSQQPHLAGVLAHLACSNQLHRDYQDQNPGRKVPREVFQGPTAIRLCDSAYRDCVAALQGNIEQGGNIDQGGGKGNIDQAPSPGERDE